MAEIQPFRAYRYDTNRVTLEDVLTQPYDKITPAMQDGVLRRESLQPDRDRKGPHVSGRHAENNVYTRAAAKVDEWIAAKILVQDAVPAIYVYSQDFEVPGTHTRRVRTRLHRAQRASWTTTRR